MADLAPNASPQTSMQLAADNRYDTSVQASSFWARETIDGARWNKNYPYQLLVARRSSQGYVADDKWTYTFPLAPEAVTMDMPFSSEAMATLGGIVEENGPSAFRVISVAGTTGMMALRGSAPQAPSFNALNAIFAGTIQASQQLMSATRQIVGGPMSNAAPNLMTQQDVAGVIKTSGYYQFRALQQWLEAYVELRRKDKAARLAFAMWKDQAVYLCTPAAFSWRKTGQSPMEYSFSLQLKAWRRIHLNGPGPLEDAFIPAPGDPNLYADVLARLSAARRVLENARDLVRSIPGDVEAAIFEPMRQTALFVKDALGAPVAMADLPASIVQAAEPAVIEALAASQGVAGLADRFTAGGTAAVEAFNQIQALGQNIGKTTTRGGDPTSYAPQFDQDPARKIFQDPESSYDFFNALGPADLNLAPSTTKAIVQEKERVRQLTRLDFEGFRDEFAQRMADYGDAVGVGDPTFAMVYGRTLPTPVRQATDDDFEVLQAMGEVLDQMNAMAASGRTTRFQTSAMTYVAGLASAAGISFTVPNSKFRVPFPYGWNLEQLAARYLGDRDRWPEIATLNNLRPPYVDEEGFDLPFLAAGEGAGFLVADGSNLAVGQQVWISATNTARAVRRITSVQELQAGQWLVQVDGLADMARFTLTGAASVHAFLPQTVNSQMTVWIPSPLQPAEQDDLVRPVPGVDYNDPYLEAGGIDLLLTSKLDLALTPDQDCRFAVGLTNIVQKAQVRTNIPIGTLPRHPSIGLAVQPGTSLADLDAGQIATAARDLFSDDPTYTRVTSVLVQKNGPVSKVALTVGIAGTGQEVPLSFQTA